MILLIQFLVSIIAAILYTFFLSSVTGFGVVLVFLLAFLIVFIGILLIILLVLLIILYTMKDNQYLDMRKHNYFNFIGKYIFHELFFVKVIVTGKENLPKNHRFVAMSNHIEYTDPIYIKQIYKDFPLAYISKESLFRYPILKTLLQKSGCIPITRIADRKAMTAILRAIKQVSEGQPMGIFPEGTRSYKNEMGPFKPGAFKVPLKAKADLSVSVMYDMHKIGHKRRFGVQKVYIHIFPLMKYEDFKDLDSVVLCEIVEKMMTEKLQEMNELYGS